MTTTAVMDRLASGELELADFDHALHVRAAWELLESLPFLEAASRFSRVLSDALAGTPAADRFNLTLTLASLSLIDERRRAGDAATFEQFAHSNPDLMTNVAKRFYSQDRLLSTAAKQTFLLPDRQPETC